MKGQRYYRVPYEAYNARDMRILRRLEGGVIAFGRWHVLLGILYQSGGCFELNEMSMLDLMEELEMDEEAVRCFLESCAKVEMISAEHLARNMVASSGVADQIAYIEEQSARGKRGGQASAKARAKATA